MRRLFMDLPQDTEGATIVEFALIAPALLTIVMGLLDLGYNMYTAQMLEGAVQTAARRSTLQGAAGGQAALDGIVTTSVRTIAPGARLNFARKAYADFTQVGRPEDYDDVDGDGTCNNGEPFEDANGNSVWDADPGSAGFGGARDAVLYTVTVTYDRAFPVFALIPGQTRTFTMRAQTVLRNQPFDRQNRTTPTMGNCT